MLHRLFDSIRGRTGRAPRRAPVRPETSAPFMRPEEIRCVEEALRSLSDEAGIRVFEYGAGYSTLHFARFLEEQGVPYRWVAVEHVQDWADRIESLAAQKGLGGVEIRFRPVGAFDGRKLNRSAFRKELLASGREIPYRAYTDSIAEDGAPFDLVIVDGRNRKQAVRAALEHLRPGGRVLLHDARRPHYRCLIEDLPHGSFPVERFWQVSAPAAAGR